MKLSKSTILWNQGELDKLKPSIYDYCFRMTDGNGNTTKTIQIKEETFLRIYRLLTK